MVRGGYVGSNKEAIEGVRKKGRKVLVLGSGGGQKTWNGKDDMIGRSQAWDCDNRGERTRWMGNGRVGVMGSYAPKCDRTDSACGVYQTTGEGPGLWGSARKHTVCHRIQEGNVMRVQDDCKPHTATGVGRGADGK